MIPLWKRPLTSKRLIPTGIGKTSALTLRKVIRNELGGDSQKLSNYAANFLGKFVSFFVTLRCFKVLLHIHRK